MANGSIGTPLKGTQRIGQERGKAQERQQHTRGPLAQTAPYKIGGRDTSGIIRVPPPLYRCVKPVTCY